MQARFRTCNLFCCNGIIFLHSGWCDAIFWICNLNSADNIPVVLFLQSSVYTVSRPLLLFPPAQQGEVHGELGGDTARTPHQMEGESYSTWNLAEQALMGERRREVGHLGLWLRLCFPGNGQTSASLGSRG